MIGKRKKLNPKNEHIKKRINENPTIEQKEFDNLLDKMIQPSERNGAVKQ
jgi:hypothetical protein